MEKLKKEKIIEKLILLGIILVELVVLFYFGNRKRDYNIDELYSYNFVSEPGKIAINRDDSSLEYLNTWHDSEYYKDFFTVSSEEKFDIIGVYNGIKEDVHPPLFYILLHISCSFFEGIFTKWSGLFLNAIFFILTILFLYKTEKLLTDSKIIPFATVVFYGFSIGAISTVMLIRMYMMMTFFAVLFFYFNILLYQRIKDGKDGLRDYLKVAGAFVLGFLTQYYFIIFAFFICFSFSIKLFFEKKCKTFVRYAISMFSGILLSVLLWPSMIYHIFQGYRGYEAFNNFKNKNFRIGSFFAFVEKQLFVSKNIVFALIILSVVLTVIFFFKVKGKKHEEVFTSEDAAFWFVGVSGFVSVAYILMISKIAPYVSERYIFVTYPFIVLFVVGVLDFFKRKLKLQKSCLFIILLLIIAHLYSYSGQKVSFLYEDKKQYAEKISEYADLPAVVITDNNRDLVSASSGYYLMEHDIYPTDDKGIETIADALKEKGDDTSFLLFIDTNLDIQKALDQTMDETDTVNAEYLFENSYFKAYIVKR